MKVHISGEFLIPVRRIFALEGNEIVDQPKDADLIYETGWPEQTLGDNRERTYGGRKIFPLENLSSFGYKVNGNKVSDIYLSRWFDKEWRDQIILGVPLRHMMNYGIGKTQITGLSCLFIKEGMLWDLLEVLEVSETLSHLKHKGFVTIGLALDNFSPSVVSLYTGLPPLGIFNVLEATEGRFADYILGERESLLESFTSTLILSRYPWPYREREEKALLGELTPQVLRHFHPADELEIRKNAGFSDRTLLGFATAWSQTLSGACNRVLRTVATIDCEAKQYRTDQYLSTVNRLNQLVDLGLLDT